MQEDVGQTKSSAWSWKKIALTVLAILVVASAFAVFAVSGGITRSATIHGPFAVDTAPGSQMVFASVPEEDLPACCLAVRDDSVGNNAASELRLWIAGREITPAHTLHETIRQGGDGFSHWDGSVLFALPAGVPNSGATEIRLTYPLAVTKKLLLIPAMTLFLAIVFAANILRLRVKIPRRNPLTAALKSLAIATVFVRTINIRRVLNIALAGLAVATFAIWLLALGVWQKSETFTGPFNQDTALGSSAYALTLTAPHCCLVVISDATSQSKSDLRLWINDVEVRPAHSMHSDIRSGKIGLSHWGNMVLFAMPQGADNSGSTKARITYSLQASPLLALWIPLVTLAMSGALHWRRALTWIQGDTGSKDLVAGAPYAAVLAGGVGLAALAIVYAGWVVIAAIQGHGVPIAAPFRSDTVAYWFESFERTLPLVLLLLSVAGALLVWITSRKSATLVSRRTARRGELLFTRWFARLGFPILLALVVAAVGASWAGVPRYTASTLAGLMPFYDPHGYFSDLHFFSHEGIWQSVSVNRPIASAVRTALFYLAGMSYPALILLQATLISLSLYWAALSISRWKGSWAALSFLAVGYVLSAPQVATLMTEVYALIFAFLSLPFFVRALQNDKKMLGAIAIALMSVALWIRIGPVFTLPALALWFAFVYGRTLKQRAIGLVIGCAIVGGVLVVNEGLGRLFTPSGPTNNFAYTLCGLSLGDVWNACLTAYPDEFAREVPSGSDDKAITKWLMAKAIENIQRDPAPLLKTMADMPVKFLRDLPNALTNGFTTKSPVSWFSGDLFLLATAILTVLSASVRNLRRESLFWFLIIGSTLASTTLTYFTDGMRVFVGSYVLLALLLALAFSTPAAAQLKTKRSDKMSARLGLSIALGSVAAIVAIPLAGRTFMPPPLVVDASGLAAAAAAAPSTDPVNNFLRQIGRGGTMFSPWPYAAGLLVVPDGAKIPTNVPAMTFSRFQAALDLSGAEGAYPLFIEQRPQPPFAVADMPDYTGASQLLVLPPEVMEHPTFAWGLVVEPAAEVSMWVRVKSATPLEREDLRVDKGNTAP